MPADSLGDDRGTILLFRLTVQFGEDLMRCRMRCHRSLWVSSLIAGISILAGCSAESVMTLGMATTDPDAVSLAVSSGLVISEIMYNPDSDNEDWEWIEIVNTGIAPVSLQGYVLDDNDGEPLTRSNIASGEVAPGESAILYNAESLDPNAFTAAWGTGLTLVPVTNWSSLSNSGDRLGLWHTFTSYGGGNFNAAIDEVNYEDVTPWPNDNESASIYLTSLSVDNNIGSNWQLSQVGGSTPAFTGYQSQPNVGNSGGDVGSPGPNRIPTFHTGACDASTSTPIGPTTLAVADDEDSVLRYYRQSLSGPPLQSQDFNPQLGGSTQESDLEGSTRIGNRVYWLGSHSNNSSGEVQEGRYRLFATDIVSSTQLSFVGRYDNLRDDLFSWYADSFLGLEESAAPGVSPEDPDGIGFNIEGFTVSPRGNQAYIGFRAPLIGPQNEALIAPLYFLDRVATGRALRTYLGRPILLDLGGRGIRSIECNGSGCLIVAGPVASEANPPLARDFKLFTWNGSYFGRAQERAANLTGLNPEAIAELPLGSLNASSPIELISDNGDTDWYGTGEACKRLSNDSQKQFRSDVVTLGGAVN